MRLSTMGVGVVLSLYFSGCANNAGDDERRRGNFPVTGLPTQDPLPAEPPTPSPTTDETGNTFFDLVGPELPQDVTLIPLRAALTSTAGDVFVVTSVHRGTQATPTPVSAGTYRLTFLREDDSPTGFTQTVVVRPGISNQLRIGSVLIDPNSAVQPDRVATTSFPYTISSTEGVLKTVVPNLNTVVDLPAQSFLWQGIGSTGPIPSLTLNAGTELLTQEWGSVLVLKEITESVAIFSSSGAVIFPETVDGVEYLLPATPQEQGCMVYLGVVNNLTTRTITLCSDAILHVILNDR